MLIDQARKMGQGEIVDARGQITNMEALNDALIAIIRQRYHGAMEAQSETFYGILSTAKDAIGTLGSILSQPLFEKLKQGLQGVIPILNSLVQLAKGKIGEADKILTQSFGAEKTHIILTTI